MTGNVKLVIVWVYEGLLTSGGGLKWPFVVLQFGAFCSHCQVATWVLSFFLFT